MTTGYETLDVLEPWLIQALKDAVLPTELVSTVVNAQTAETVNPPYLLISHVSTRDIRGVGTTRVDTDNLYAIKAVHRSNSFVPGRAVMRAVETAISGKSATTSAGSVTCVRDTMFHYPETIDGVQFMHVGANYRFRAAST
jgi:hypothetical protein